MSLSLVPSPRTFEELLYLFVLVFQQTDCVHTIGLQLDRTKGFRAIEKPKPLALSIRAFSIRLFGDRDKCDEEESCNTCCLFTKMRRTGRR